MGERPVWVLPGLQTVLTFAIFLLLKSAASPQTPLSSALRALYVKANLSFADAYHVVLMEQLNLRKIVTFDTDLDRITGITRVKI